jgi:uncharacterized protein (DUF2147 family)
VVPVQPKDLASLTFGQVSKETGRSDSTRWRHAGCLAIAVVLFATQSLAGEAYGIWKTEVDGTGAYLLVEVADCDADAKKLCAKIIKVINSEHQEIVGKQIFWNLTSYKQNKWKNGKIWDVPNDRVYPAKVTLDKDTMRVEGCIAILCDGQNWSRAK